MYSLHGLRRGCLDAAASIRYITGAFTSPPLYRAPGSWPPGCLCCHFFQPFGRKRHSPPSTPARDSDAPTTARLRTLTTPRPRDPVALYPAKRPLSKRQISPLISKRTHTRTGSFRQDNENSLKIIPYFYSRLSTTRSDVNFYTTFFPA